MRLIVPVTVACFLMAVTACGSDSSSHETGYSGWSNSLVLKNDPSDPAHCVPNCADRWCGDDGCGGTCGSCFNGLVCNEAQGQCVYGCSDLFEPDNEHTDGSELDPGDPQKHSICPETDKDWFEISLGATSNIQIVINLPDGHQLDVSLLDGELTELGVDVAEGDSSHIIWEGIPTGTYRVLVESPDLGVEIPEYTIDMDFVCIPTCTDKECGGDGCGGDCGTCGDGFACGGSGSCASACVDEFEPDDYPGSAQSLMVDEPRKHSICPALDVDWFRFTLDGMSDTQIWATTPAKKAVRMSLYNSSLKNIGSAVTEDWSASIDAAALAKGTYYVTIESADADLQVPYYEIFLDILCAPNCEGRECGDDGCGGTCGSCGDLQICDGSGQCASSCVDSFEPDDGSADASVLKNVVPEEHSICPKDDKDWFRFTVPYALSQVHLETSGMTGDTEMWLYDSEMNEIDYDDDSGVYEFSLIEKSGLPKGTYYAEVRSKGGMDPVQKYTVFVQTSCTPNCQAKECGSDGCGGTCGSCPSKYGCAASGQCESTCIDTSEPDDAPGMANLLLDGVPRQLSLCPSGDVDWLAINLVGPSSSIEVKATSNDGALDVWLLDAKLGELDSDGSNPEGIAMLKHVSLPEGIYFVRIMAQDETIQMPKYTVTLNLL